MPSCRKLGRAALPAAIALAFVALPFRVTVKGGWPELSLQSAFAKDGRGGSNGNGGGNGEGRGQGNKGNGQGEGGGSNKGEGNSKGGGNGKGGANGKGSSGTAAGHNAASIDGTHVNPSTGATVQVSGNNIDVLYHNGMRERIKAGRYLMKDGKGRTIIERRATGADAARLRGMAK